MYDKTVTISVGGSRKSTRWTTTEIAWSALCERLHTPIRGKESHEAYMRMPKAQQDALKDIGGFVGGTLRGNRRKAANVTGRDLITLDLDAIPKGATEAVCAAVSALGCASAVYSTRKHEPARPRLRVLLPLDRTVTAEEYEPIARRVAEWLGIEQADPTTFESWRLMYWPSCSADSEYVFDVNEGDCLSADAALRTYRDWHDMRDWPQVPGQQAKQKDLAAKQEDPEGKKGVVGAFCRTYTVRRVMDELIPGVYEATDDPDRFTFTGGSTSGGAILYEEKWLYSHHATDPCSGQLVNAWDLARLHLFGEKDADAAPGTPVNKLPSFEAMRELAMNDDGIKRLLLDEARASISEDFGTADPDGDWRLKLEMNKKGDVLGTLVNLKLIFENDPALQCVGNDAFLGQSYVYGKLPWDPRTKPRVWTDSDDTGAAWYVEAAYGVKDLRRIKMAADAAMEKHQRDALREYLEGLVWDGVPRVDTLLTRYFRADDTAYTRAVTRKFMVAAVARGMDPGCKFDNVLTLIGAQGTGKSLFADILGGEWYNDNIQTFTGKESSEQLRGVWSVEIPEVDRFSNKFEASAVKQFITRRDDIYRVPFERRTTPHPRRCVFIASTNAPDFLTDTTGNRRWWIVRCHTTNDDRGEDLSTLRRDRDQVWAEAVTYWRTGEPLTLGAELYADATERQESAVMDDPWTGMIEEFLRRRVPPDWDARKPDDRRLWWSDEFGQRQDAAGLVERKRVCVAEVWYELFGKDRGSLDGRSSRRIMNVLRKLEGWTEIGVRPTVYGGQKCLAFSGTDTGPKQPSCNQNNQNNQTTKTTEKS